jgi:hypothetical protein
MRLRMAQCCKGKGKSNCPKGTPLKCDLECAIDYLPVSLGVSCYRVNAEGFMSQRGRATQFFEECQNLIQGLSPAPTPTVVIVGKSSHNKKVIPVENVVSCKNGRGLHQVRYQSARTE